MQSNNNYTEKLFSYGTLQFESVQKSTFGRKLNGVSDFITGYQLSSIEIKDSSVVVTSGEAVHPILIYTGNQGDKVAGLVFDISMNELQQADTYEVDDYKRVLVELVSGKSAWVYVAKID